MFQLSVPRQRYVMLGDGAFHGELTCWVASQAAWNPITAQRSDFQQVHAEYKGVILFDGQCNGWNIIASFVSVGWCCSGRDPSFCLQWLGALALLSKWSSETGIQSVQQCEVSDGPQARVNVSM